MTFGRAAIRPLRLTSLFHLATLALLLAAAGRLIAADEPSRLTTPLVPAGYRAPGGFGDVRWGDSLAVVAVKTHGLKLTFVRSVVENAVEHGLRCYNNGSVVSFDSPEAFQKCLYLGPTRRLDDPPPPVIPQGFYLIAEYLPLDATPQSFEGVTVMVSYVLCIVRPPQAGREGPPAYSKKDLRLCAVRLSFEGRELLPALLKRFGTPPGYTETPPTNIQLEHYRWCGSRAPRDAYVPCIAAVAFAFDPQTQRGQLLMATPAIYSVFSKVNIQGDWHPFRSGAARYYAFLYEHPLQLLPRKGPFICPACALDRFGVTASARRNLEPDP